MNEHPTGNCPDYSATIGQIVNDLAATLRERLNNETFVFYDPLELLELFDSGEVITAVLKRVPYINLVNISEEAYQMAASVEFVKVAHQMSPEFLKEWCSEHSVRGLVGYTGWLDWSDEGLIMGVYFSDPATAALFVLTFS